MPDNRPDSPKKNCERDKAQIMPTGDTALNILGFSTQVPTNAVYITNSAKRKVKVGDRNIIFKNVVQKTFNSGENFCH
ncbi:MAG: DUF6088 family protein [Prevotellaceae bacterium]|nr:DUF6088 family protein [Prevotellaceae bacterium]